MSGLDQIQIDSTDLLKKIQSLKNNPRELQQFIQSQQATIYKDITLKKDDTFQKVYGNLENTSGAYTTQLTQRNQYDKLSNTIDSVYKQQSEDVTDLENTKNLANRKYEMNEWTIGNKKDTLFVYSMIFIGLCIAILVSLLWRMGIIGTTLFVVLNAPILIIITFTIVYRSQYTDVFRNKRYWNRRIFKGEDRKIPIPNICPGSINALERDASSFRGDISTDTASIMNKVKKSTTQSATAMNADIVAGINSM